MIFFKKLHLSVSKSLYSINGLRLSINQASLIFCIRLAPLASQARFIIFCDSRPMAQVEWRVLQKSQISPFAKSEDLAMCLTHCAFQLGELGRTV